MAATTTATESSTNDDSPRSPTSSASGVLPSLWAQVVKDGAGELPEKDDTPLPGNIPANEGNAGMKLAWNKPANQVSPLPPSSGVDQGVVMEPTAWPALSESTRLPLKPTSFSDSSKHTPKVSPPVSQGPINSNLHQHRQGSATSSQNSSINGTVPARQRSMKRGGGGNRQGGYARDAHLPPPVPAFPVPEMAQSSYSKVVPGTGPNSSFRVFRPVGGFPSHPNPTNDYFNQRSFSRRGNFGQYGNGDGRNNYHRGRRDQDRKNHDWGSSSSSHARGSYGYPHRPHDQGFLGLAGQCAPHFTAPQNGFVYPDSGLICYYPSPPPDYFRATPYYISGPAPPSYLVASDPLRISIINQIEFYFSDANLVKDQFLRSKMDDEGWVPITLIANFPRVQSLTEDIPFIKDCLGGSTLVEVQGDKLRRCNDWGKWIIHQCSPSESGAQYSGGSFDKLTTDIVKVSLEEK